MNAVGILEKSIEDALFYREENAIEEIMKTVFETIEEIEEIISFAIHLLEKSIDLKYT